MDKAKRTLWLGTPVPYTRLTPTPTNKYPPPPLFKGHLEFFICNSADLQYGPTSKPNQECFNMNPLTRAEGDDVNSPIDPAYPGRYYVNPPCHATEHPEALPDGAQEGYVINMQYQLPEGLTCDHCVLQMVHCEFSKQGPYLPTIHYIDVFL